MRYFVSLLFALALLVTLPQRVPAQTGEEATMSAASAVHAKHKLPPRLMLRPSYYLYLDAAAAFETRATSDQTEPNAEKLKSAQADGGVATSESNLDETESSPGPGTEVPDIETLSQRAIEHYEIHYKTPSEGRHKPNRNRRAIALGVTIPILVAGVGLAIGAAVAMSNWKFEL